MKSSLMLLGCLCVLSLTAQAQEKTPAQTPAPTPPSAPLPVNSREACKTDMQNYCSSVQPGRGRMRRCLNEHKSALSEACRNALRQSAPKQPAPKKPASKASPTTA